MRKKFWTYLKSRSDFLVFSFILVTPLFSLAAKGVMPIDDTKINFSDGRTIIAERRGVHSHTVILRKGKRILWARTFEQEYGRLWDYTFFVPVKNYIPKKNLHFPQTGLALVTGPGII